MPRRRPMSQQSALTLSGANAQQISRMFQTALTAHKAQNFAEAESLYKRILKAAPNHFATLNLSGVLAASRDQPALALKYFDQAISVDPNNAAAHTNRGNALRDLGRLTQALDSYSEALSHDPNLAETYLNRGMTLQKLKRYEEAIADFDTTLSKNPKDIEAINNRGAVLNELRRYEEAAACFQDALRLKPDFAEAFLNYGNCLAQQKKYDQAFEFYNQASTIRTRYAAAYLGLGGILDDLIRPELALPYYEKALQAEPNSVDANVKIGYALNALHRHSDALKHLLKALKLAPERDTILGSYLNTKMQLADWKGLKAYLKQFRENILSDRAENPFVTLGLVDDPLLHLKAAKSGAPLADKKPKPRSETVGGNGDKIRVGYFSPDFRNHPVSFLAAELFEVHDKERFEVYGFWFGPESEDEMRCRISKAFTQFIDIREKSDAEVRELCEELGISIAVDLAGHTQHSRLAIFAGRCAPIQVSYLGYAGTTGVPCIDYIIADKTVIPEEHQCYFTEKPVYLPGSFQVNDSQREISDSEMPRSTQNLPEDAFVYCCFNRAYKITPEVYGTWMQTLGQIKNSVLWLSYSNATQQANLRRVAESYGIAGERLVFAERMPSLADHLARHRLADLFLDTTPYNAHTTASDALWAGLPLLTYKGNSFASRVSASLLHALELKELVTESLEEYQEQAIKLASEPGTLARIREKLAIQRDCSILFNGSAFARHLESAYLEMVSNYRAGLPPATITVERLQ